MIDEATWAIVDISAEESRRLRELPYGEFLETPYWRAVRRIVIDRAGHKCEKCGNPARDLQVHHKPGAYKHNGREHKHLNKLLCWCGLCHSRWHFSQIEVHTKQPGKGRARKTRRGKRKRVIYFR